MIADDVLASCCMAIYEYNWWKGNAKIFEYIDLGDTITWGLVRFPDYDVIVFRGTASVVDWMRDFMALSIPIEQGPLGPLHPGFKLGCEEVWRKVSARLKNPFIVTGHSLGGAHASIVAGIARLAKHPPARRVTFGAPRPGFKKLAALTAAIPSTLYLNGWDIVPSVPVRIPPLENYVHDRPLTKVWVQPHAQALALGPFAWHHMMLYEEALKGKADGQ